MVVLLGGSSPAVWEQQKTSTTTSTPPTTTTPITYNNCRSSGGSGISTSKYTFLQFAQTITFPGTDWNVMAPRAADPPGAPGPANGAVVLAPLGDVERAAGGE